MSPDRLAALRNFFARIENRMPEVVSMMYGRIFEAAPEARALFKGDIEEQMQRYGKMLQAIVKLTRSSHLWPVRAFTGEASLPFLDKMGTIHADAGVTLAHVNLMKRILSQCCEEIAPGEFTLDADEALGFIFDVLSKSLTKSSDVDAEHLTRKNQPPRHDELPPGQEAYGFFDIGLADADLQSHHTIH
ncbi:MAG: globin domain-containing protein [Rhodomicrobium sp.]